MPPTSPSAWCPMILSLPCHHKIVSKALILIHYFTNGTNVTQVTLMTLIFAITLLSLNNPLQYCVCDEFKILLSACFG